jgi:hypothetical protein
MFRFAVAVTIITSSPSRKDGGEHISQRTQYIDAFDKANAIDVANSISNHADNSYITKDYSRHRIAEAVAIAERHDGTKLQRSVFTFRELDRICKEWTLPAPQQDDNAA